MRFQPERIEEIDEIECRVEERPWDFAIAEAAAVERHWAKLTRQNAHLYNGRVFLLHRLCVETAEGRRILRGAALEVDYKAFIAWRDFGAPDRAVCNCFAMGALRSSDHAFVLGRMGAHTSNAGRIYFASGTPDPHDKRADGTLDLEGSALRELYEETGLAPKEVTTEPRWTVVFSGSRVACMKSVHSPLSADEIMERFAAFAAAHATPELAGLHSVYTERDLDLERMPDFTVSYLRYALAKASAR